MKLYTAKVFAVWVALVCAVEAAPPSHLKISQGYAIGNEITLYASVLDEAEGVLPDLPLEAFAATVGAEVTTLHAAQFAFTEPGIGYILLVDLSRSLRAAEFATIQQALREWVERLGAADQATLIAFGEGVRTLVPFSADQEALKTAIDGLRLTDNQTYLHQALVRAMNLGRQELEGVPRRRVIITLTDGLDDVAGGVTEEELFEAMQEQATPIYSIGFSRPGGDNRAGFRALGRFSRASGGVFVDGMSTSIESAYSRIHGLISEQYQIDLRCESCVADGTRHTVQLLLRFAGVTLRDSITLRLFPADQVAAEVPEELPAEGVEEEQRLPEEEQRPPEEEERLPEEERPPEEEESADSAPPRPPIGAELERHPTAPVAPAAPWWQRVESLAGAGMLLALLFLLGMRRRKRPQPLKEEPVEVAVTSAPASERVSQATYSPPEPVIPLAPLPPVAKPRIRLTPLGGGEARTLALPAEFGRSPSNHWPAPQDDTLSAHHARLIERDDQVLLEDLGSTNGTFLNGVRIHAVSPLQDGDLMRVGEQELRVQLLGEERCN